MKDVIDLLKDAILILGLGGPYRFSNAKRTLVEVIKKLKTPPSYETPEQYKKRTGKEWPDNNAVYFYAGRRNYCGFVWGVCRYETAKRDRDICVIASESGVPPDDWKPDSAV